MQSWIHAPQRFVRRRHISLLGAVAAPLPSLSAQIVKRQATNNLRISHDNSNSGEYEVKLALVLPGQTFATGGVSEAWEPSLEKSVHKMIRRVEHYKATMSGAPDQARIAAGTTMEVEPNRPIDGKQVVAAVESGNYTEFRKAMYPIEASLRDRVGRWVQRYPQIQAKIGTRFTIADIVEETFILAFDRYKDWRPEMFFGQWIETLIDPAMKAIARDPEGELEAISFQQTWNEI